MHECGVLGTASAAFSHSEGNKAQWVAVQSRGTGNAHREVYLPQLGQPCHMCVCVRGCVTRCIYTQTACYT